ncbi:GntR family transcriptional regulator [Roseomonas nepalensis]|uniref:GntR family transcriptional regulator n=1 Tax=Muricoccus nepalensis TaxID=1854500 RepID=A0A502G9L2_9PROT|nr:GntR family transcriptional regulator [Roseomonas nepalensis]TPG57716.1 GntR family transcriptional regulator [Roseomonas nepalensis]
MKPAARPPTPDLGRDAYERVKAAIREGTLPPGTRLTEAELVARLGISRTPIRQALTRLETEGLVSHEPRRGVVVSRPDHQQVIELYSIREVLEGTAARFAAQHASEAELEALTQLVAGEGRVLDRPAELSAINLRLHALLHRAAHNRYLLRALAQLTDNMALLPTMLGDPARARQSHEEHRALLEALKRRDGAASEAAMAAHLRSAQRHRIAWLLRQLDGRAEG